MAKTQGAMIIDKFKQNSLEGFSMISFWTTVDLHPLINFYIDSEDPSIILLVLIKT